MAQAFNWDEHPIAKAEPTKSKEFNWDEHPIESKQEPSTFSITPRGLLKVLYQRYLRRWCGWWFCWFGSWSNRNTGGAGLGYSCRNSIENIGEKYLALMRTKLVSKFTWIQSKHFQRCISKKWAVKLLVLLVVKIASKVGELAKWRAINPMQMQSGCI